MSITWKIDGKTDMVTVTIPGNTLLSIVNHATINMQICPKYPAPAPSFFASAVSGL